MRISKETVIKAASDIADQEGLNNVSIKAVSDKLGIRSPSLYNHVASLNELLREVAHKGMQTMNNQLTLAAVGKSGNKAIHSVSTAYFHFLIEHPGIYETIQWAIWHPTEKTLEYFEDYTKLLEKLILSCGFSSEHSEEIRKLLTGILHGYSTLQLGKALVNPEEAVSGLSISIDTILAGIHTQYHC